MDKVRKQPDLFEKMAQETSPREAPLADRMRPRSLEEFVGQSHLLGEGKILRIALAQGEIPSLIFWGPPGTGKTSLAMLIAGHVQAAFVPFSAVTAGIKEIKEVIAEADRRLRGAGQRTVLFVDEIHRFNKAQQDAFLPHVERGTITLIGATTENPSFEVIAPLLSRAKVLVLQPLSEPEVSLILGRALADAERGLGRSDVRADAEVLQAIAGWANGDARAALNLLELAARLAAAGPEPGVITSAVVQEAAQHKSLLYDKAGEEHYNLISAYIKSLRDSDPDGALYWLARMLESGEDPKFIARRLVIFASEDVGNADPTGIMVAAAVAQAVQFVGLPEAQINLAQGTTYLATRPKDNASYTALLEALKDAQAHGNLGVPLHLRNAVTSMMRDLGYGKDYRYVHDDPQATPEQEHLPEALKGRKYYKPKGK